VKPPALLVTPRTPWPLDDGGRISLWQSVWSLAQDHDLTLVTMVIPGDGAAPPAELARLGVRLIQVPHRPPPLPLALLQGTFGRWPYMLARFHSPALERTLAQEVARSKPAFVCLHGLHLMTHHGALAGVPCVLRVHDVEHLRLARYADTLRFPPARVFARDQVRRMRRAEAELIARADLVLAVQPHEAEVLRSLAPRTRVEVVPLAVDFTRFGPRAPQQPPVVLLVGTYDWPPNAGGALRFVAEGWPRVRARVSGARLRIVGRNLPPALAEAARQAGAEPVGYVESVADEFAAASVLVVPLWAGAGSRVKIVEALGAGLPVVSTTIGAEGLGVEADTHLLLADTPADLGDGVTRVLTEPSLGAALAAAGRTFALGHFELGEVARRTSSLCDELVGRR
jgi:polysaccharide biosynthesis protein PslH